MNEHTNIDEPIVKYSRPELPRCLNETEAELRRSVAPIWQMRGRLVEMIRLDADDESEGVKRHAGALQIHVLNDHRLLELMLGSVKFASWNERRKVWVRSAPPLEFSRHYNARGAWGLRVLRGIVEAPTMRPDGTILSQPGFDDLTGIYLDTGGVEFPPIPDQPTRSQALAALGKLKDVIKDFPFVLDDQNDPLEESAYRSVALSAILTAVSRKALRTAPGHGFDATSMATGKTLLCDTISMIATGRPASTISQGKNEEEFNKRLFSILLQGDPVITIDNIEQPVRSDEFCTVLTSETWQCRVLGISGNRTVMTNVLFLLNGNGLTFEGDIRTRVLICRMDSRVEDPGARRFDRDLREWVPQHRAELVVAALTALRAFVVAGRPGLDKLPAFGRFEDWSDLVRGALVWLGEPDPCATRQDIDAHDPEREALSALHRAWRDVIGAKNLVTAKALIEAASPDLLENVADNDQKAAAAERLRDALEGISPRYSNPKVLGTYLSKYVGRIVDGYCIREHAILGKSKEYLLDIAIG
ncbi:hypothetical protein [Mesorhizobium sp. 10J20-29]